MFVLPQQVRDDSKMFFRSAFVPPAKRARSGAAVPLEATVPVEEEAGTDLGELLDNFSEFCRDVYDQTKCRRCGENVPMLGWTYVRLESLVSPIFRRDEPAEVGIQFQCSCGAIHIGEPLPQKSRGDGAWTSEDRVVEVVGRKCPVREKGPSRQSRGRDETGRKAWADLIPRGRARRRSVSPSPAGEDSVADKEVVVKTPCRGPGSTGSFVWGAPSELPPSGGAITRSGGSETRYVVRVFSDRRCRGFGQMGMDRRRRAEQRV